jgi:hypothetical protein
MLFSREEAGWTRKRLVRSQAMPSVDEALDVHWSCVGRFQIVHQDVKQSGVLHPFLGDCFSAS